MRKPSHAVKYILAVLLLATLTTTQILSVAYAKYTTTSGPVGDSARVAVYELTATGANSNMHNAPDSDKTSVNLDAAGNENLAGDTIAGKHASMSKVYAIVSNSEVAVSYNVVVTLDKALPTGTTMELKNTADKVITPVVDGNTYTYTSKSFVFEAMAGQDGAHAITLTFITDNADNAAVSDLSGIGVSVVVNAEQINE